MVVSKEGEKEKGWHPLSDQNKGCQLFNFYLLINNFLNFQVLSFFLNSGVANTVFYLSSADYQYLGIDLDSGKAGRLKNQMASVWTVISSL